MTGLNVAFRIAGDSFVPKKIDNPLTASPSDYAAAIARVVFTSDLSTRGREKE